MTATGEVRELATLGIRPESSDRDKFRGDIEGLRAIAVGLVVLYHAGVGFLPGGFVGVDVFFVISGFLITGLLLAEMRRTGTISLKGFYARRAKRLLPATAVVLGAVAVLSYLLLPETRWIDVANDLIASGVYATNWRLAARSVDYLAQGDAQSPVQHFWSLAVEEQFYLVWPLLMLAVTLWVRPRRRGDRGLLRGRNRGADKDLTWLLCGGLGLVAIPSLAWSIHLTTANPGQAYFVTTTRVWELAVGGSVAILAPQVLRIPRVLAALLGWAGVTAVLATGVLLTESTPFPGAIALVPTLGTGAVIASGRAAGRLGPVALLGLAPMRWVGKLSYSLYLWHWPLIVIAAAKLGGNLSTTQGLIVAAGSFIPAYLSYRLVEDPPRRSRTLAESPTRALQLGLACTLLGAMAGVGLYLSAWPPPAPASHYVDVAPPPVNPAGPGGPVPRVGAEVLGANPRNDPRGAPVDKVDSITPDPIAAERDFPTDHDCPVTGLQETVVRTCNYGDPASETTVLLLGDSHAQQWIPALAQIATAEGWNLIVHVKASCPFIKGQVGENGKPYPRCATWNKNLRRVMAEEPKPKLVITTNMKTGVVERGKVLSGRENSTKVAEALRSAWREFTEIGVPVAVIRDTPTPGRNIPDCVAENRDHLKKCAVSRSTALQGFEQMVAAKSERGVHLVDLTDAICPWSKCAPVIGGVLLWKDHNHLTRSYVLSLTPRLQPLLGPLAKAG